LELQLQAIVTLLALVNPAMCAAIFLRGESARPRRAQVADAVKAGLTVLIILALAALFGAQVLHVFGVSLDAFSVAGGGVLAWIGISMLRTSPNEANDAKPDTDDPQSPLTPLIMFAASPGTITGVITLAVSHSRLEIPVTALVAVGVATTTMCLVLLLAIILSSRGKNDDKGANKGAGFFRDTVTRFMGLIVIAMGVQFALTGIRAFMAA
jgi:multiple antibiotic resistance protein